MPGGVPLGENRWIADRFNSGQDFWQMIHESWPSLERMHHTGEKQVPCDFVVHRKAGSVVAQIWGAMRCSLFNLEDLASAIKKYHEVLVHPELNFASWPEGSENKGRYEIAGKMLTQVGRTGGEERRTN